MRTYPEAEAIAKIINEAQTIVIMQAGNPDADSLGSALAMEQILGDMGKTPLLYCGIDMPTYLRYLDGWDRVAKDLPRQFDASIIVDASTITLFDHLEQSGQKAWAASKPCIVLDHHPETENDIPFASVVINDVHSSSTGELISTLGRQIDWPLSVTAQTFLMTAILGDTQGLSNQLTSPTTYRLMADMTEAGVDRASLEEKRREINKMPPAIYTYKSRLIARTEFHADGRLAMVSVPNSEISEFSPLYNPAALIQPDMLQTQGVLMCIVFKTYDDGRITAAIRCNHGGPVAAPLAEHFGGGGHPYASGFKITNGRPFNEVKSECIGYATDLLNNIGQDQPHETLQHAEPTA